MARTSSPAFDEHESPTAKRAHLDAVDLANAANRTQELNPRALLGDKLDRIAERERPPSASTSDTGVDRLSGGRSSGTQPVVSADGFARQPRPLPEPTDDRDAVMDPIPGVGRWTARVEGRLFVAPSLVVIAVLLSLAVGFFVGGLR